ncbi:MAG: hypothetical protein FK734_13660 [Asgard group archaeon]|nr:hypothetical protein [Asgard group archaeon]
MKLKLTKVSNQWSIYQQLDGAYKKVGKILSKPTHTTLFSLFDIRAQIATKEYDDQIVLILDAENIHLKSIISTQNPLSSIVWKDIAAKTEVLKVMSKNNQTRILFNKNILAKHYQVSKSHLFNIANTDNYSPIVILAAISPFFLQ